MTATNDPQATDREALRQALAVVLARARCKVLHNQTNGGRCAACISWAEHVGVPEHLSRIEQAITDARAEALRQAKVAVEAVPDGLGRHVMTDVEYVVASEYDGRVRAALSDLGGHQ